MKSKLSFLFLALAIILAPVRAQAVVVTVNLSWIASTTVGVNYNVYQESVSGACTATPPAGSTCTKLTTAPTSVLIYTDSSPVIGKQYFWVVRAVSANGVESANSNEASLNLTQPNPTGTLGCVYTITGGQLNLTCK